MGRIFLHATLYNPEFTGEKRAKLLEGLGRIGDVVPEPRPDVTAADAEGAVASIGTVMSVWIGLHYGKVWAAEPDLGNPDEYCFKGILDAAA